MPPDHQALCAICDPNMEEIGDLQKKTVAGMRWLLYLAASKHSVYEVTGIRTTRGGLLDFRQHR